MTCSAPAPHRELPSFLFLSVFLSLFFLVLVLVLVRMS